MEEKFKINVPYDNAYLVAKRKKTNISTAILMFVTTAIWVALAVGSCLIDEPMPWLIIVFAILALVCLGIGIYAVVRSIKPSPKDHDKMLTFRFYDEGMGVHLTTNKNGSSDTKKLHMVRYASGKEKQFISKIVEDEGGFEFEICIGTTNTTEQYKKQDLPKSCFKDEQELEDFITFIKGKVSQYKVKETKSRN